VYSGNHKSNEREIKMTSYIPATINNIQIGDIVQVKKKGGTRFSNSYRVDRILDIDSFLGRARTQGGLILGCSKGQIIHYSDSTYRMLPRKFTA